MDRAPTRLRRTFAYPSDSTYPSHLDPHDSDSDGPPLDEQEQEDLIQSLAHQNATRNAQFRIALLALPALATVPYIILLFFGSGSGSGVGGGKGGNGGGKGNDIMIATLSLSSLLTTAWMLWVYAPGSTGIEFLDAWVAGEDTPRPQHARSPMEKYAPYLNLALCGLLVLAGLISARWARQWGHVGLANLPAVVYGVVLMAKMVMGSTDPERELGKLRYGYKGA